jgi:hypothetical protein
MPVVTFACPDCGKVLKSSQSVPAGKKIKCPACATVFPMPADADEELSSGLSTKPRRPVAPVTAADDEDEPRPRRRSRDDDDDEDGDRPRRKGKKNKARKRRLGGAAVLLAAGAVVLLLLLGGGGVAAYFIWFSGVNRGSGNEDPLAYVPAGTEVLAGVDGATLLGDPALGPQIEQSLRQQAQGGQFIDTCRKETGLEFKELFAHVILCTNLDTFNQGGMAVGPMGPPGGMGRPGPMPGGPGRPQLMTMIFRPSRPFDQKKLARSFKDPVRKTAHGKSYYEVNDGEIRTVFMPSDRTLVMSSLSAAALDALFTSDGLTPSMSADAAALVRGVDKTTLWFAVPFEGSTRTKLDQAVREAGAQGAANPLGGLEQQLAKGKGAAAWGTLAGEQVQLGVNLVCADAGSASQVVQEAEKSWNQQKLQITGGIAALGLMGGMPKLAKAAGELTGGLKFASDGALARISTGVSRTALTEAVTEAQAKAGGGAFGPPGGFGPGMPGGPPAGPGRPNPGPGRGQQKR